MKITPLEIRQKTFEKVFRGYDKDEVHAFMNSLSHEWERVLDDYKEMKFKLEASEKEVEKLRQVESSLYKTLKTAEDTGANLIDQANRAAELHMREAQMKADETIKNANERARKIVGKAENTSKNILNQMADAIKNIENDYYRLSGLKDNLIQELKSLSTGTLERLENYQRQKSDFEFEEHLKNARNLTRINVDYDAAEESAEQEEHKEAAAIPPAEPRAENRQTPDEPQEESVDESRDENKSNRSFFDDLD